jgi:uncharacterized protein YggE
MRRLVPLLLAAACSGAGAADLPSHPFVTTGGKAQLWVAPDIGALTFEIGTQHGSAEQATATLEESCRAIATLLAEHGVADADIDGSELSKKTMPLSKPAADGSTSAYLLTRYYRVQVRDLAQLPDLVAALLVLEHVDTLGSSFDHTNKEQINRELMVQAAADARANGTLLAESFGRQLGPAVAIARGPLDRMGPALLDPPAVAAPALPPTQQIRRYTVPPLIPFAQAVTAIFRLKEPGAPVKARAPAAASAGATTTTTLRR